jgi:hypothetical protein
MLSGVPAQMTAGPGVPAKRAISGPCIAVKSRYIPGVVSDIS